MICTAHNRDGSSCDREPVPGRPVCRIHGGLGGAPLNNANRLRHGLYARKLHKLDQLVSERPTMPNRFQAQHAARVAEAAARTIARRLADRVTLQITTDEWRAIHEDLSAARVLIAEAFRAK